MCGVAGFIGPYAHNATLSETAILRMLERLHHRGPDGKGHWLEESHGVMLGHTRLAIVDTSDAGKQPMHLQHLHVVVNGEIYNYPELRQHLETQYEARFLSQCDSEVVLHGYAHEGVAFFARMNGMFAFALYDAVSRNLMLVRDRAGIKPLYYCQRPEGLFFASEIKSLLAPMPVDRWQVDLLGLSQYLSFQTALAGRTLFEGVSLLLPGQMLTISADAPHAIQRISYVPPAPTVEPIEDFSKAVATYRQTFDASIGRHLLSDVPIASYISAGLDSASVAATAATALHSQGPLTAFTGCFPDESGWYDETSVAAEAITHFGGIHQTVDIGPRDLAMSLDAVIDALDEPKMGMGAFSQFIVARQVASRFKVVLTGHGGDELFAGYPLFKLARLSTWWRLNKSELPHLAYFLLAGLRKYMQPEFGRFLPVLWSRRAQEKMLGRSLQSVKPWLPLAQLQAACANTGERIYETYLQEYLPNLLVVEDKISMAHSLESRTPFLDHHLLALSRQIPLGTKLHEGQLKAIIKAHAKTILPPIYFRQPKRGFPTPLRRWLRTESAAFLQARLLGPDSALPRLMQREVLAKEVRRYTHSWYRHVRPLDEIQSHRIWQLLSLESWLRQWEGRYGIRLALPPHGE